MTTTTYVVRTSTGFLLQGPEIWLLILPTDGLTTSCYIIHLDRHPSGNEAHIGRADSYLLRVSRFFILLLQQYTTTQTQTCFWLRSLIPILRTARDMKRLPGFMPHPHEHRGSGTLNWGDSLCCAPLDFFPVSYTTRECTWDTKDDNLTRRTIFLPNEDEIIDKTLFTCRCRTYEVNHSLQHWSPQQQDPGVPPTNMWCEPWNYYLVSNTAQIHNRGETGLDGILQRSLLYLSSR